VKRHLHIVSQTTGSVGEITYDLIPYLQQHFILTIEGTEEPKENDILLLHFLDPSIVNHQNFSKFKKKVLIQPIDGFTLKPYVIELLNKFDLIITPGNAGRDIMLQNGVTSPITVIPNFFKEDIFIRDIDTTLKKIPNDKVIFYHESTFHSRKGIEPLLEGYVKAFSDTDMVNNVVLVLKDLPINIYTYERLEKIKKEVINLQSSYKHPAKIIKISQHLDWSMMKKIWANVDIYVSFPGIEGFGIPMLRMAALNKPILTIESCLSGYMDWLNHSNSYLIPGVVVSVDKDPTWLYEQEKNKWVVPRDIKQVIAGYYEVYNDFINNNPKLVSYEEISYMTIENVANLYIQTLNQI
jgi:hypothetical protein